MDRDLGKPKKSKATSGTITGLTYLLAGLLMKRPLYACIH